MPVILKRFATGVPLRPPGMSGKTKVVNRNGRLAATAMVTGQLLREAAGIGSASVVDTAAAEAQSDIKGLLR